MRIPALLLVLSSAMPMVLGSAEGSGPLPARGSGPGAGFAQAWLVPPLFSRFPATGDRQLSRLEVTRVLEDSPAQRAGLQVGDRLLAVGGYRVHDTAELKLVAGLIPAEDDAECWSVLRQGQVLTVTMRDLLRAGVRGVGIGVSARDPDMAQVVEACGLTVAAAERADLNHVPTRAVHALQDWLAENAPAKREVAWLRSFVDTYVKVLRCQDLAAREAPPDVPVPYLAQLERFYRAIATGRAAGDQDPDPARLGCDRAFFALSYPWPSAPSPDLGRFTTSDAPFNAFFRRVLSEPGLSWAERKAFGSAYAVHGGDDHVGTGIEGVKRALIEEGRPDEDDPSPYQEGLFHGSTSSTIFLHRDPAERAAFIAELRRRYQADDVDALLLGYALAGALLVDNQVDEAFLVMERLLKDSPYIGWRATLEAPKAMLWARSEVNAPYEPNLQRLQAFTARHPVCPVPRFSRAYAYSLARSPLLQGMNQISDYDPLNGRPAIWRANGELVYAALDPDRGAVEEVRKAEDKMIRKFLEVLECSARDARTRDSGDALAAVAMAIGPIRRMAPGLDLKLFFYQPYLAAGFALGGDFGRASAWQDIIVERFSGMRPDNRVRIEQLADQRSYLQHRPPGPHHEVRAKPLVVRYTDGKPRIVGGMVGDQAEGRWCFYHPNGQLCASGSYLEGVRSGIWQRFADNGTRLVEGAFADGHRIGRWRTWHADGTLFCEGCYGGPEEDGRLGRWSWLHPNGQAQATGLFLRGKKEGRWLVMDDAGRVIGDASFSGGNPQGAWQVGATAAEPPAPLPPWPDLPGAVKPEAPGTGAPDQPPTAAGANDF